MANAKPMRAGLYLRVSTSNGQQTVETQRLELVRYCEARGWEIAEQYEDQASGAKEDRPGLARLMADARRRRFDVVLCVRLDRMGRSLPHLISILQELGRFGVAFTSVAENIDLTTPAGKLVANFLAAIAEFERHLIRERVLAGLRRAKSTGVRLGRPRRGFDVNEALNFKRSGLSWKELARKVSVPVATLRRTLGPLLKNPDAQSA